MTTSRTVETYGGPYLDERPVEDPTTQQAAAFYDRHAEDTAQMTRTSDKALFTFSTSSGGAGAITVSDGRSHAGVGAGQLPVGAKVSTGLYTFTFAASFEDDLEEEEIVSFGYGGGRVKHLATAGHVQVTGASNVISVAVFDMAGVLSDLGGGIPIEVDAR